MKKKIITITNAYTWYNKGDAGILLGIVETLKKIYGEDNMEINILSFTPDEDKKRYCKDKTIKTVESNIINPHPYKHTKIGKIVAMLKLGIQALKYSFKLKFRYNDCVKKDIIIKRLYESDEIIVCGGGFLGGKKLESLIHLFQININTKMGKPVYVMGASIEPIKRKIIKYYTQKILKKVEFVFARETITEKYLQTFLKPEKFTLIPDMAFMLTDINKEYEFIKNIKQKGNQVVGITVRNWNFPNAEYPERARENYIKQMVNFLEYYIKNKDMFFIFIPQVIVNYASDTEIAIEIKNNLKEELKEKFIIREDDWSPLEIKSVIGNMNYFVGTRMHSNIFSTSMNIPTLAIAYEKKTNGIMETVGQEKFVVDIDDITSENIIEKFETIQKNKEKIIKELKEQRKVIQQEILAKTKKILVK